MRTEHDIPLFMPRAPDDRKWPPTPRVPLLGTVAHCGDSMRRIRFGINESTTVSVLFCDLVGSTERFHSLGDDEGGRFTQQFLATCAATIESHGGRVIKTLGDGAMAVFGSSAVDALRAAGELHEAVAVLDEQRPPLLRVGVSAGEVTITDDGDLIGGAAIEASRLCSLAPGGATFTTTVVRGLVGQRGGLRFSKVGSRTLKGIPEPVDVVRLERGQGAVGPAPAQSGSRRRWLIVAAALGLLAVVVSVVLVAVPSGDDNSPRLVAANAGMSLPGGYEPRYELGTCPREPVKQRPAAERASRCGVLHVPERRDKLDGPWIEVAVDEFDPLSPGTGDVVSIDETEHPDDAVARTGARLIRMTPRGEAGTPLLTCPEIVSAGLASVERPLLDSSTVDAYLGAVQSCRDRWSADRVDVAAYGGDDIALDARDLIVAMDLEQPGLMAAQNMTAPALEVLRLADSRVRWVTLVNPIPAGTSASEFVDAYAEAMSSLDGLCQADTTCHTTSNDLVADWKTTYQRWEATPQLVTSTPGTADPISVLVDGDRLAAALSTALGLPDLQPYIPTLLRSANAAAAAGNARDRSDVHPSPYGAELSQLCEAIGSPSSSDIARMSLDPQYAVGIHRLPTLGAACERWAVPEPAHAADVSSSTPVLVVRGALSPTARVQWVDKVVRRFEHFAVLDFPSLGFEPLVYGPSCLTKIRRDFQSDPTTPLPSQDLRSCEAASPVLTFAG